MLADSILDQNYIFALTWILLEKRHFKNNLTLWRSGVKVVVTYTGRKQGRNKVDTENIEFLNLMFLKLKKVKMKIMYWWYLNRYYSTILSWHYYLVSMFAGSPMSCVIFLSCKIYFYFEINIFKSKSNIWIITRHPCIRKFILI